MKGENRYYRHSKIPESKFRFLSFYFACDLPAAEAARLCGVTRKTATNIYLKIRRRLAQECRRLSPLSGGLLQLDETHSCTTCSCGNQACGINHGKPVFSILEHDHKIFTTIIPDCKKAPLRALIRGRHVEEKVMRNNGWHGYDGLVDVEYERALRVEKDLAGPDTGKHSEVDNFWGFSRARLEKFYGITNRTFPLHLKECEWRFNMRERDLYRELLFLLEEHPL